VRVLIQLLWAAPLRPRRVHHGKAHKLKVDPAEGGSSYCGLSHFEVPERRYGSRYCG